MTNIKTSQNINQAMTQNKALQSTQPVQPAYLSSQQEKASPADYNDVRDGDYPPTSYSRITMLMENELIRDRLMGVNGLSSHQYKLLIIICGYWLKGKKGITCYRLCKHMNGRSTASINVSTNRTLVRLIQLRLIEVIGKGEHGSNLYGPASTTMTELASLLNVA